MGVDVVDLIRVDPGVGQGLADAGDRAPALVMAVGDPEGVGRGAVADDLAVDPGPARLGVLQLLENQHARPLAEDEAVAVAVERTAGRVGSSLRVERAVSRMKPVTPNGWIMLCVPPESITSAHRRGG